MENYAKTAQVKRELTPTEAIAQSIGVEISGLEIQENELQTKLEDVRANLYRLRGARDGMLQADQMTQKPVQALTGAANFAGCAIGGNY